MAYGQALKALWMVGYLMGQPHPDADQFKLYSPAFNNAGIIPPTFTCQTPENVSLPLAWQGAPAGTKSLALLLIDMDAPRTNWYHWAVYNIPPTQTSLPILLDGKSNFAENASNSWGLKTYQAPCPPQTGEHHYVAYLYALDIRLSENAQQSALEMRRLMRDHIIAKAKLRARVVATN